MRLREVLKSKIHKAVITRTELDYQGSIGIDKKILKKTDISPGEKVQVLNFDNGMRFETYVIEEKENSGNFILYGPAARCGKEGDRICVISYSLVTDDELDGVEAKVVFLNEHNKIIENKKD